MVVLAASVIGAIIGWWRAGSLGGDRRDRLQYAIVYGLILTVVTLFVLIILQRWA